MGLGAVWSVFSGSCNTSGSIGSKLSESVALPTLRGSSMCWWPHLFDSTPWRACDTGAGSRNTVRGRQGQRSADVRQVGGRRPVQTVDSDLGHLTSSSREHCGCCIDAVERYQGERTNPDAAEVELRNVNVKTLWAIRRPFETVPSLHLLSRSFYGGLLAPTTSCTRFTTSPLHIAFADL